MTLLKTKLKLIFLISFALTFLVYWLTLNNSSSVQEMYFTPRIIKPFYIGNNPMNNIYTAGVPAESTANYTAGDCPCGGVNRFRLLGQMIPTTGFVVNFAFWSIFPAAYFWLRRPRAHTGN